MQAEVLCHCTGLLESLKEREYAFRTAWKAKGQLELKWGS